MLPFLSDKIFMDEINKWKTKKHFEVLISCTENNKSTKPKNKKEKAPSSLWPTHGWFPALLPLENVNHHTAILKK